MFYKAERGRNNVWFVGLVWKPAKNHAQDIQKEWKAANAKPKLKSQKR